MTWVRKSLATLALPSTLVATLFVSEVALADLVITMGGDVNFNKDEQSVKPDGVMIGGKKIPFTNFTKGISHLINGDLNFANVETVVSDRTDLKQASKKFTFISHPNSIQHMIDIGFNMFSLANNHSYDYGINGLIETHEQFADLQQKNPAIVYVGGGSNREAAAIPVVFDIQGYKVAFASIGIVESGYQATDKKPGLLNIRNEKDFALQMKALKDVQADLKIISMHFGTEAQVKLDSGQQKLYNRAIDEGDVDLIIGHHPHVVRPVEMVKGRLIIYSLGNYLMPGAANIDGRPLGYDYGLFSRVYFGWDSTEKRLKAQAMEAVPLKSMHISPVVAKKDVAAKRIQYLNNLSKSEVGKTAVSFTTRADGTGIACANAKTTVFTARASKVCQ